MEDFVNEMAKNSYFIKDREGRAFLMRPLIYDSNFIVDRETTQA